MTISKVGHVTSKDPGHGLESPGISKNMLSIQKELNSLTPKHIQGCPRKLVLKVSKWVMTHLRLQPTDPNPFSKLPGTSN